MKTFLLTWNSGFQHPVTPGFEGIVILHHDILAILITIVLFVIYILLRTSTIWQIGQYIPQVLWRYNARAIYQKTHLTLIEVFWTVVPGIILGFIILPSFSLLYGLDDTPKPLLTVKCIGNQWYWRYEVSDSYLFDYYLKRLPVPEHLDLAKRELKDVYRLTYESRMLATPKLNDDYRLLEVDKYLILPPRTYIRLIMTSLDVLHSWAVPALGVKMDCCPGRLNTISVYIEEEGVYFGQCSEICGVNHAFMPIGVIVPPLNLTDKTLLNDIYNGVPIEVKEKLFLGKDDCALFNSLKK